MRLVLAASVTLLFSFAADAADYSAFTSTDAVLRAAPSDKATKLGVVAAGTPLEVEVCFDRGAFCLVSGSVNGFVSGDLMTIGSTDQTVHDAESAKWADIDSKPASALPDFDARNIVVWGDSLSANTFGDELSQLLTRQVSMQGVPGEDGAQIAKRRLATTQFESRIAVIWDRHYTNENPDQYMADLQPIFDKLAHDRYVVISDIRSLASDVDLDQDRTLTEKINARLKQGHPNNFLDLTTLLEDPASRRDGLHLTPPAYDSVAEAIAAFVQNKGW